MLVASALFCHAPIVIPSIAGHRANRVQKTTESMRRISNWLLESKPDRLVVLSPHAARLPDSFSISSGYEIAGSFADFGHPEIGLRFPIATTFCGALCAAPDTPAINVLPVSSNGLDHGAAVPLHFLREAGWNGPVAVVGFPHAPTHEQCRGFGEMIAEVAMGVGGRTAIVASGDMSHSLTADAPCGFHPMAQTFDDFIVDRLRAGDVLGAIQVDEDLRENAAEDIVDSLEIASAATRFATDAAELYSYEGPFGVGYSVAALHRAKGAVNA